MRRLLFTIALAAATVLTAPMMAKGDDDGIAQFIMQKLKVEQQRGNLRGFHVDMRVDKGTVWFEGYVSNAQQEQLILRTAQSAGHIGVVQVVDDINIRSNTSYLPPVQQSNRRAVQAQPRMQQFQQMQQLQAQSQARPVNFVQDTAPMPVTPPNPAPVQVGQGGAPVPVGYAGQGAAMATDHPQMPGYAWPGYAAHPNYAAVTYPKMYSPTAWPYIGPFYPYPQVPLGWRKVTLEWDDGWWFLDFNDR